MLKYLSYSGLSFLSGAVLLFFWGGISSMYALSDVCIEGEELCWLDYALLGHLCIALLYIGGVVLFWVRKIPRSISFFLMVLPLIGSVVFIIFTGVVLNAENNESLRVYFD